MTEQVHFHPMASMAGEMLAPELRNSVTMTPDSLNDLAHEIAEETAKSDIECHTLPRDADGMRWWNTASADVDDYCHVCKAVQYLEGRGLLIRHAGRPYLVRWEQSA